MLHGPLRPITCLLFSRRFTSNKQFSGIASRVAVTLCQNVKRSAQATTWPSTVRAPRFQRMKRSTTADRAVIPIHMRLFEARNHETSKRQSCLRVRSTTSRRTVPKSRPRSSAYHANRVRPNWLCEGYLHSDIQRNGTARSALTRRFEPPRPRRCVTQRASEPEGQVHRLPCATWEQRERPRPTLGPAIRVR